VTVHAVGDIDGNERQTVWQQHWVAVNISLVLGCGNFLPLLCMRSRMTGTQILQKKSSGQLLIPLPAEAGHLADLIDIEQICRGVLAVPPRRMTGLRSAMDCRPAPGRRRGYILGLYRILPPTYTSEGPF
jgi:hypothetical protein